MRLLDLVRSETQKGACVLYTAHYMEEAEKLCDYLAIIDHGKIIAAGTLAELRSLLGERDVLRLSGSFDTTEVVAPLSNLEGIELVQVAPDRLTLAARDASSRLSDVFQALLATGAEIRETTLTQPSLESLFIKLTGKELRE